jgi:hypothetical protein
LPSRKWPALTAVLVLILALPFFLIAGWPVVAWGLAAALWAVLEAINLVATRLASRDSLRAAGLSGFVRMLRLFVIAIVLALVAKANRDLLLPLIGVFALAYTSELGLSLISYFGNEPL